MKSNLAMVAALSCVIGAFTWPPRDTGFDADKLCALHVAAHESGDYLEFLSEVARELDVELSSVQVDPVGEGVFVKTSDFFVEEQGFFIARPSAVLHPYTDPSFKPMRSCIYRYKIVG